MTPRIERLRTVLRYILAAAYGFVGIVHLRSPEVFLPIVPDWVPFPRETVLLTGAAEIAGAVALLTTRLRYAAGVMLALYAVCVFPANVKHAMEDIMIGGTRLSWWYHGPRLAFQPVIVWWALFCGGVISWPFRQQSQEPKP
ncbi:MAG: DoxX family protein [Alphaproteobacteria bacterium]|nr:DoxX family protein [Alphaproteobacteria bacterium]